MHDKVSSVSEPWSSAYLIAELLPTLIGQLQTYYLKILSRNFSPEIGVLPRSLTEFADLGSSSSFQSIQIKQEESGQLICDLSSYWDCGDLRLKPVMNVDQAHFPKLHF